MRNPDSVSALIDLWPSRKDMASDLGILPDRVHKWAQVNAIPARFHLAVINAGNERGFGISADLMVRLHARANVEDRQPSTCAA